MLRLRRLKPFKLLPFIHTNHLSKSRAYCKTSHFYFLYACNFNKFHELVDYCNYTNSNAYFLQQLKEKVKNTI